MHTKLPIQPKANKSRLIIGIMLGIVLLGGVVSFITAGGKSHKPVVKTHDMVTITLPPPPLPPPPPPPPPPPKDQEMIQQEPVADDEPPPDNSPPTVAPTEDLTTGIAGNGPDMGIGRGNGRNGQIGGAKRRGGGSKFGWYAAKVQTSIAEALRRNPATKSGSMSLQVRIWPDSNGRITRAQLVGTTGNATTDQAIKDQVLTGLQLPEAPPADMPTPIVLRITARKAAL